MVRPTAVTNTIRALRTERGLTQAQLAQALGITRQTVIAVEQGRWSPSLELAFQIAHVLGRPIDQVFAYEPDGSGT
ncbi:helix-turn-helix transcriptional regulator [Cellulomonas sp. NPDC058312]|uniref:helix-turn-helix transcriptional regulator n=1 Tax=Cellulomonas sp. NPDC058312 TaxID=3346441 RepID=UPI0036F08247